MTRFQKENLKNSVECLLNPHLSNFIDLSECLEVKEIPAVDLLTSKRIDVMAKLIYAKHRLKRVEAVSAERIYRAHLEFWNGFVEADGSNKKSATHFISEFNDVIKRFYASGFDDELSLIPIDSDNVLIDGAHRLAAALATSSKIKVAKFPFKSNSYSPDFFLKRGVSQRYVDEMVYEYCRNKENVRVAVTFPVGSTFAQLIEDELSRCGEVFYKKKLTLSERGQANLIRLIYKGESWLGGRGKDSLAVRKHVSRRFKDGQDVELIFFESNSDEVTTRVKADIRNQILLGNDPIHINDTHQQTLDVAESVLFENNLHHLNFSLPLDTPNFDKLVANFKSCIQKNNLDLDDFVLDGSSVMALYGIRDVGDLDFLTCSDESFFSNLDKISEHSSELKYHKYSLNNLVYDPSLSIRYEGVKVISLPVLQEMKKNRGEFKDRHDNKRIKSLLGQSKGADKIAVFFQYAVPQIANALKYKMLLSLKSFIPDFLIPYIRYILNLPFAFVECLKGDERERIYKGFQVYYSRGTTLINEVRSGNVYEPKVTDKILAALTGQKGEGFVDVGSNIGLISLNILQKYPETNIYAFEPGEHQAHYFKKTIEKNGLDKVVLSTNALGNRTGTQSFYTHSSKHASGDGFYDTGRAGVANKKQVNVIRLDDFWEQKNKPKINVIKIDTEGAELWVLKGALKILSECKPVIIFEMHETNLKPYPYDSSDIVNFFDEQGFFVETIDGQSVSIANMAKKIKLYQDYIAYPKTTEL